MKKAEDRKQDKKKVEIKSYIPLYVYVVFIRALFRNSFFA
jgi:hypothetical protein